MPGHGFYNQHSQGQGMVNRYCLPLLADAVNAIDLAQTAVHFRIADYGSAQGRNSLPPIKTAIAQIKSRWNPIPPVTVTHTDLPTNDWATLFQTVLTSTDSYLAGETNVFAFASGTSIYSQIFPPNHIALGYSAIVEHWLSHIPTNMPGHIWTARITGKQHDALAAQAKDDWYNLLRFRAVVAGGNGDCNKIIGGLLPSETEGLERW